MGIIRKVQCDAERCGKVVENGKYLIMDPRTVVVSVDHLYEEGKRIEITTGSDREAWYFCSPNCVSKTLHRLMMQAWTIEAQGHFERARQREKDLVEMRMGAHTGVLENGSSRCSDAACCSISEGDS